jgi:hypothetical protein
MRSAPLQGFTRARLSLSGVTCVGFAARQFLRLSEFRSVAVASKLSGIAGSCARPQPFGRNAAVVELSISGAVPPASLTEASKKSSLPLIELDKSKTVWAQTSRAVLARISSTNPLESCTPFAIRFASPRSRSRVSWSIYRESEYAFFSCVQYS